MSFDRIKRTPEQEQAARRACYKDCQSGDHLDHEAGCTAVCRSEDECEGWVPYLRTK